MVFLLASTAGYGGYQVAIKYFGDLHFSSSESLEDALFMVWICGALNILTCWPGFIITDLFSPPPPLPRPHVAKHPRVRKEPVSPALHCTEHILKNSQCHPTKNGK